MNWNISNTLAVVCRATCPSFIVTTHLTHDSPSVRKTYCGGRKHKENVKDYYQRRMEEQAEWQNSSCISTSEDTSNSILSSSSCRSSDPISPQSPGASLPKYDNQHPTWRVFPWCQWWVLLLLGCHETCSWNEAAHGKPCANDAWASSDETSSSSHDDVHLTRLIRTRGGLFLSVLY
jgi:hypothetical protein